MRCSVIRPNNNGLEGPAEVNPRNGEDGAAITNMENDMNLLEEAIKQLSLNENANFLKAELISKLEVARTQSTNEKRRVRKAAWSAETQPEVAKLAQFFATNPPNILFPSLVWKRIMEQVEDLKEKAMLSNMSMIWRDALKDERTTFLFYDVFPMLNRKGILSTAEILACRGVCREWKRSIEYWQQLPIELVALSLLEVYQLQIPQHANIDRIPVDFLGEWAGIFKFLNWSKRNYVADSNPIFPRRLRVGCIGPHDSRANSLFWSQIKRLLVQWGREVWSLEFIFSNPQTLNFAEVYKLFCTFLRQTPNLRLLSFISQFPIEDTERLKVNIEKLPLPELLHMDTLLSSNIPPAMIKHMLNKFGPSLRQMYVYGMHSNEAAYSGTQLPNLKTLHLIPFRFFLPEELNFQVDWPSIEDMDLHYKNFLPVGLPQLFKVINDFGGKLRKLNVKLEEMQGHGESAIQGLVETNQLMLELPNLESFSLAVAFGKGSNLKTIDFILPMVSLRYLTLCYVKSSERVAGECEKKAIKNKNLREKGKKRVPVAGPSNPTKSSDLIQYWEYVNRLYDSNIWRLLPELRTVTIISVRRSYYPNNEETTINQRWNVNEKVYTREGYREHVRK